MLRAPHGLPTTRFLLPSFKKYSAWSRCFPFHAACSLEGFALPYAGWPAHSSLIYVSESRSVTSNSLRPHGLQSPWNSLGQNTGVGCHATPQGNFPTQGSNPGLPHCRWTLYQLSYHVNNRAIVLIVIC